MADAVKLTKGHRLAARAAEATEVRGYEQHRDVVALGIEKIRRQVDVMMWLGVIGGLVWTAVNVQAFVADDARSTSLTWWTAWLLDPMVSLGLIALIRAEQVTSRYQVEMGPWVRNARWFALAATYTMNCWQAWADLIPSDIVQHSIPVLAVLFFSESIAQARFGMTQAVKVAVQVERDAVTEPLPVLVPAGEPEPAKRSDRDILDELAEDIEAGRGLPSRETLRTSNLPMGSGRAKRLLEDAAQAAGVDLEEQQAMRVKTLAAVAS